MSNFHMSDHTPVGGGGAFLKGMDVLTVNHLREGSYQSENEGFDKQS